MENKGKVSVFKAAGEGTLYFLKNLHLILLFMLPVAAYWVRLYFKNSGGMTDPLKIINPMFCVVTLVSIIFGAWAFSYLMIRTAAMPDVLNLDIKDKALTALKRLPGFLAVYCMYLVGVILAFFLLIIPGIIVAVLWSQVLMTYVLYGGAIKSFQEGRELVKGYGWKVFGMGFLYFAVMMCLILPVILNAGMFAGISGSIFSVINMLLGAMFSFWMLALYKQIAKAKQFTPDTDRKGTKGFYKFFMVLSIILGIVVMGLYAFLFLSVVPEIYRKTGMEVKTDGRKSITYMKGVPKSAVEYNRDGTTSYAYYYENGNVKSEMTVRFVVPVGQTKEYYENGKIKETKTYEKGKLNGESLEYDTQGNLVKKCSYINGKLAGCEEIKQKQFKIKNLK